MGIKGKKAEPSREELEFIYARLHLSDSAILEEMQDADFTLRGPGFIKRRRKEFAAARAVLEELVKKEFDPVLAQRRKEHWAEIAEVAAALLSNFSKIRGSYRDAEVLGNVIDGGSIWLGRQPMPSSIPEPMSDRDDSGILEKVDSYIAMRLLEHVKQASSLFNEIEDWRKVTREHISEELMGKLLFVAHGGTFDGTTCLICKPWYQ